MITVILRGGLGNQMFQYASGLGIAKSNGTDLVLDATYLNDRSPRGSFTRRNYCLDIFDMKPKLTRLSNISARVPIPGLWLGMDFAGTVAGDLVGLHEFLREKKNYVFDKGVFGGGNSSVLWGFWQTEKYFAGAEAEVRAAFRFKPSGNEAIAKAREAILHSNAVSLHVRRGDYLLPKFAKFYGATDVSYYEKALAYIAERVTSPKIFVFSDDIAWCKEHIKTPFPLTFMGDDTAGAKASGHLELMSLCKHNIITNSSFSWWGAWLNENPGKIVIAPQRWSVDGCDERCDVTPEGWIKL